MLHESDTDAFGETAASSWDADRVATDPRVLFATRAAHARARFAGAVDARGAARVEYALVALMMAAMALVVYETARTTPRVSARV